MECVVDGNGGGSRLVLTELSHIKELVKQLDVHLGGSPDLCKHLAAHISIVTEKSIVQGRDTGTSTSTPEPEEESMDVSTAAYPPRSPNSLLFSSEEPEQTEMECVVDGNGGGSRLVLSHIKELVKQLDVHLGGSPDLCKHLAAHISIVTEKSIVQGRDTGTSTSTPEPEEESMDVSTAAYPPRSPYRDLIRRVAVSRAHIRSTLFSRSGQSGHSGSSYSSDSASHSYPSNNSGCSSGLAAAVELGAHELSTIARRMVSDGYTQRMVQAFSDASPGPAALGYNGGPDSVLSIWFDMVPATPAHVYTDDQNRVLETWFFELDVAWVLQIRQEQVSQWQLRLQDDSGSSMQDLVERWIRGLTVIVHSIIELQSTRHEMTAVKRFGEASIFKMHIFIDAMVPALKAENLPSMVDMYICAANAMTNISEGRLVLARLNWFNESTDKLREVISSTMEKVMTLVEDVDSWAIEIPRGRGEIHSNTRWIADCIVFLAEAEACLLPPPPLDYSKRFFGVKCQLLGYLKGLLVRKSELYSDPRLRYLFLLNNFHFVAQTCEPCETTHDWKLTPKCEDYIYSYLDVSWGHVLACIPKSHFPGPLHRWINTSSLRKFESEFNKTYQAQKFWKVPDPRLRDALRRAITEYVVSSYREYLNEHPELAEHVTRRNSTPEILEEMLGELFEG